MPPVLAQRHALKQEFEPVIEELPEEEAELSVDAPVETLVTAPVPVLETFEPRPVSVTAASRIARATKHKHKAAFTLRLDEERHLRLRLASAVTGRSAQQIVTGALDAFLESLPEVAELARQLPTRAKG